MTNNILPIRKGLEPATDLERELVDWCLIEIRKQTHSIDGIALATLSHNDEGSLLTHVNSWSPTGKLSRFATCSMASTLLIQRAMED